MGVHQVEDEEEDESVEKPFVERPRKLACPECDYLTDKIEDFAAHLERHRPVLGVTRHDGLLLSKPCPKECGRNFVVGNASGMVPLSEFTGHTSACRGEKPLVSGTIFLKEDVMAKAHSSQKHKRSRKWRCDEHDFETSGPREWGRHKREKHDVAASVELKPTPLMRATDSATEIELKPKKQVAEFTLDDPKPPSAIEGAILELETKAEAKRQEVRELELSIVMLRRLSK